MSEWHFSPDRSNYIICVARAKGKCAHKQDPNAIKSPKIKLFLFFFGLSLELSWCLLFTI